MARKFIQQIFTVEQILTNIFYNFCLLVEPEKTPQHRLEYSNIAFCCMHILRSQLRLIHYWREEGDEEEGEKEEEENEVDNRRFGEKEEKKEEKEEEDVKEKVNRRFGGEEK